MARILVPPNASDLSPNRERSMPFLTVDATIGIQVFQNGRCHVCLSLGLGKVETGYNLVME